MYDTIHIFSECNKPITEIERYTDLRREVRMNTGEEILKGTFKNFSIMQKASNLSLKGSLAKYYFDGSNLETLTRGDTKNAIEKLSDELSMKIKDSRITRIDVATNFIMKENYKAYFNQLGDLRSFYRSIIKKSTLQYENGTRTITFYDKLSELERKQIPVPADIRAYKGRVLRYECRFLRRVKDAFKMNTITAGDLYTEEFYSQAANKWKDFYFAINKLPKLKLKDMALEKINVKIFLAALMLNGIEHLGGFEEALNLVEYSRNKLNRVQISRLKSKVKSLSKQKYLTEPQEAILELDAKIKRVAEQYR